MDAVLGGGCALAIPLLVLFASLQRPSGVQHAAKQSLLTLDHLSVQAAPLQAAGQLLGLVGHLPRPRDVSLSLKLLQLLSQCPLPGGQTLELVLHAAAAHHGKQPLPLSAEPALL